ncbi:Protein W02H5.2 [Aphelenchoides avenae]|nr:Protein W02H5.2 [Aphelenchus avenae]
MAERTEGDVDQNYLKYLEDRLNTLKDPNYQTKNKTILSDLAKTRDQQLYNLITGRDFRFEDDFVDVPLTASWLQRKVAPQSVAVNKQELVELVKNDALEV